MRFERFFASIILLFLAGLVAACGSDDSSSGDNAAGASALAGGANGSGGSASTADSTSWQGKTFLLDIPTANWSEPQGVGRDIGEFVPAFLIAVESCTGDSCSTTLGTADSAGAQLMCGPTQATTGTSSAYPEIEIGPVDLPLYIQHVSEPISIAATAYDLTITNVLPDGETTATDGELTAVVDARELYPLFTQLATPSPELVCTALGTLGAACEACRDGEAFCLTLKAVRLGATLSETNIQPVDSASLGAECTPTAQ